MIYEIDKVIFEDESGGVDLLGLQNAFEKKFTEKIMPGITVLTRDVRYYGFICWAISEGINPNSDLFFNKEQELSSRLAKLDKKNNNVSYLGIRKASKNLEPPFYKTSIWSQYKSSMINLFLIEKSTTTEFGYNLTETGKRFANIFNKANFGGKKIKDNKIHGVKQLFEQILFDGDDNHSKNRKKYKTAISKAVKNTDFYKSLESSNHPILKNASLTAQTINKLTIALDKFHSKIGPKGILIQTNIDADIKDAIEKSRKYYNKIQKGFRIDGLPSLFDAENKQMLGRIIQRHLAVKQTPLLKKTGGRFFITKIQKPKKIGFFEFRQGALVSLMRSLDRMEGTSDNN